MKIGVMQPYFFPYLGYWQLVKAVDVFVLFDDVNYINRGWINRNRIILNGEVHYINLPMIKASQNKLVNEIEINQTDIPKTLNKIREAYKKAPYYDQVMPVIENVMSTACTENVARYLEDVITAICDHLGITTQIRVSSKLDKNEELHGEEKIIDVCKVLGGDHYINAIGGTEIYHEVNFSSVNMRLSFIKMDDIRYRQFGDEFYENLSIIDVLMFNPIEEVRKMLDMYELIDPPS